MHKTIDINCDLGEGLNNEALLMPYISSCSIACGGHAGDKNTIERVIDLAKKHQVKIGAHPSFPDKVNFGRVELDMSFNDLAQSIEEQLELMLKTCEEKNVQLNHVKPHGALYNLIAKDASYAELIASIVKSSLPGVKLFTPYKSEIHRVAHKLGIQCVIEAFADRNYQADLSLVSRKVNHAIINDKERLLAHLLRMIEKQQVLTIDGTVLEIKADTYCMHGDHPEVLEMLKFITANLHERSIKIA